MIDLAQLIPLAIQASIFLLVFALGLRASYADATYVLRRPGLLARALFAMYIVVPVFAAILAALFDLTRAVKVALLLIAVSPVPPILPGKQLKFGARARCLWTTMFSVA
ncbi:MAG: hypothetical protein E6J74_28000 [Deltaproteobacteria bacterium]|nr:MAG: hypothetical protein E6J74_28000 [Deltaproteobacteria bacterium]